MSNNLKGQFLFSIILAGVATLSYKTIFATDKPIFETDNRRYALCFGADTNLEDVLPKDSKGQYKPLETLIQRYGLNFTDIKQIAEMNEIESTSLRFVFDRPLYCPPSVRDKIQSYEPDLEEEIAYEESLDQLVQSNPTPEPTITPTAQPEDFNRNELLDSNSQPTPTLQDIETPQAVETEKPEKLYRKFVYDNQPLFPGLPELAFEYEDVIIKQAKKNNLDPNLIAALITQESSWVPEFFYGRTLSSSGAVGAMQVMPSDGISAEFMCEGDLQDEPEEKREDGEHPCFMYRPTIAQLQDPTFNIKIGTQILRQKINVFGSVKDGLKGYGPIYNEENRDYEYANIVLERYRNIRRQMGY